MENGFGAPRLLDRIGVASGDKNLGGETGRRSRRTMHHSEIGEGSVGVPSGTEEKTGRGGEKENSAGVVLLGPRRCPRLGFRAAPTDEEDPRGLRIRNCNLEYSSHNRVVLGPFRVEICSIRCVSEFIRNKYMYRQ